MTEEAICNDTLLYTRQQAAMALNVSERTLDRLREKGEISAIRIGRSVRIETQAVHHYLEVRRAYNGRRVESAVRNPTGESICRIGTRKDVKMAVSTKVRTTRSASPQMKKTTTLYSG